VDNGITASDLGHTLLVDENQELQRAIPHSSERDSLVSATNDQHVAHQTVSLETVPDPGAAGSNEDDDIRLQKSNSIVIRGRDNHYAWFRYCHQCHYAVTS